ncbi:MAG TPA: TetR/AcrR family transcriptional regulator [Gammaproteobacteria bacterium]|nr:TetR/AcrR family transcriptional regulator [Gammaproteobacteria bacterium]
MTTGRPREFDTNQALAAAMHQFWQQGYTATSLQDLLKAMQISKSSFYQTFGSKHALFQRCMEHYRNTLEDSMLAHLQKSPSARQFIDATFRAISDNGQDGDGQFGCLIMNTASEFAQDDPVVAKLVRTGTEKIHTVFLHAIKRAQADGEIPGDKNPEALASYLLSSMGGLRTMAKAGTARKTLEEIVKITLSALD